MALSSEQMKEWVQDLAVKNWKLQSKIRELEREVKALKLKSVGPSLDVEDTSNVNGPKDVGHEKVYLPLTMERESQTESDSGFSDQLNPALRIHPLHIEAIVEVVMSYVEPKDLPSCRLVCKLWKKEVRVHFEKKVTFHIHGSGLTKIKTFMDYTSQSFPMFQNLRLDVDFGSWSENGKNVTELLARLRYGRTLRKFKLNFGGEGYKRLGENELPTILGCMKNIRELELKMSCLFIHSQMYISFNIELAHLTTLRMHSIGTECHSRNSFPGNQAMCLGHGRFYRTMLQLTPNLETLHWGSEEDSTHCIQSLLLVKPPKLKQLFIHTSLETDLVESIANSQLKLKRLYLTNFKFESGEFGVDLYSEGVGQCEVRPNQFVYWNRFDDRVTSHEIKAHSENALSQCGDVSCTELLQVAISAIHHRLYYQG